MAELGLETKGTKAELLAKVEKYLNEQGDNPPIPPFSHLTFSLPRLLSLQRRRIFWRRI